jgi:adenosylcobinamide kinase/adenosylcobinamide-phosphate guanylyltransferase
MRHLILGGARSGKSRLAEALAAESGLEVIYIATAEAGDREMAERIARHRQERPDGWTTVEETLALGYALRTRAGPGVCIIVDCLTLWLSNLMAHGEQAMTEELEALLAALPALPGRIVLVSNEVGLGIVPDNPLARRFRDEAGRLNQAIAARCERVTFVAAGLPMELK